MIDVRDMARIRDISDRSISHEIPDPDDQEALVDYAKLVWEHMINDERLRGTDRKIRNGQPGRLWQGRIVKEVFYSLWPRLEDSVMVGAERDSAIRSAIMGYLKKCRVLLVDDPGTKRNAVTWWVAEHWQPMTVTTLPAPVESPEKAEETGEYPCRICGAPYDSVTKRGGHEYSACRAVVAADGTVYSYGDPQYTPKYMTDAVLRVLEHAEKPLSFNAVSGRAYEYDPRLGKPTVRQILLELSSLGAIKTSTTGRSTLYELEQDRSKPVTNEQFEAAVMMVTRKSNEIERPALSPTGAPALVNIVERSIAATVSSMKAAREAIDRLPECIEEMQEALAEKDRTIEALRAKLIHKASEVADPAELEAVRTELGSLREEFEVVKAERDRYKNEIETFRAALAGLVKPT